MPLPFPYIKTYASFFAFIFNILLFFMYEHVIDVAELDFYSATLCKAHYCAPTTSVCSNG